MDQAFAAGGGAGPRGVAGALAEAALELLWPTRCAGCDQPGELLCEECRASLPWVDQRFACPVCGAPFGWLTCTECDGAWESRATVCALDFAGAGALAHARPRRHHVVREQQGKPAHVRHAAHAPREVLRALLAPERALVAGSRAHQHVGEGHAREAGELARDELHVVEAAPDEGLGGRGDEADGVRGGEVRAGRAVRGEKGRGLVERGGHRGGHDGGEPELVRVLEGA
ncbi:MAG: double zinc ribbon domain-containing protein, partial [Olsenella sp.]|nr:double zinc ribbon domain-containing protein [Olsenella sp.]